MHGGGQQATFGPRTEAFAQRVRAGETVVGTTLFSASPIMTEVIAAAGFDFLIVDTEHTPLAVSSTTFQAILLAGLVRDLPIIVRVAGSWNGSVQSALDGGAAGVILSAVRSADEATRLVQASRFPPRGSRGACPVIRATGYFGDWGSYRTSELASPLVGVLIEDPDGVARADEILATDVDFAWFGPWDYSVAAGVDSLPQDEMRSVVNDALGVIARAARARKKAMAAVAWDADAARDAIALGANMVVITSDLWMFHTTCAEAVRTVRRAIPA